MAENHASNDLLEISLPVKTKENSPSEAVILIISSICTICIIGWGLWCFRFGIDFADESFYLVWISNPFKYAISTTQFGFIYHPLYEILDGNVALLRQVNALTTFCLAWILCFFCLDSIFGHRAIEKRSQLVISAAVATASLCFLRLWLPTPSYNWLNFQALLIATIGLLLAEKDSNFRSIFGWFLIGLGGWLAFMAKPTTAAALGVVSVVYLLGAGKLRIRLFGISIATAALLFCCSALMIDGSIIDFVSRIMEGAEQARALSNAYDIKSIFRIDLFEISRAERFYLLYFVSGMLLLLYLSRSQLGVLYYSRCALIIALALGILAVVFGVNKRILASISYVHMGLLSIPVSLIIFGLANTRGRTLGLIVSCSRCSLILLLAAMPLVFAFGTGNNYWVMSGLVGLFWVLAGIVFLSPIGTTRLTHLLLSVGFAVQFMSVNVALGGAQRPYYQPNPVRDSDYRIDFGRPGSTLIISESFGRYVSDAVNQAKNAGFEVGTPMIDLTGHSPGVLYALGASSSGAPWIYGNFVNVTNVENVVTQILKKIECKEIARAWLLLEPDGPVKISSNVLIDVGADLSKDFEVVGTFSTAAMVGGFQENQNQQILRPTRPENLAVAACKLAKE